MASAEPSPQNKPTRPLLPPEERFWKRYSPHYELPLASATSIVVHGMVLGMLAIGGLAFLFRASAEASRPPDMDMVLLEDGALGSTGGAPAGVPGLPGDPADQEPSPGTPGPAGSEAPADNNTGPELPTLPSEDLKVAPPDLPASSDAVIDPLKLLDKIKEEADDRSKPKPGSAPKAATPKKSGGGAVGTGNPKGTGGGGGTGGIGGKGGPGGGIAGRKMTEQEIKAWRWRFDLSGSPKEHADKLDRAGVIVAIPPPGQADPRKAQLSFISDLKRRPVTVKAGDFANFEEAVKWYNTRPESVRGLARELQLTYDPAYVVLLLPKDREAKMAAEEARYARHNRMDLSKVQETTFDFQLRNGVYEPVVIRQR
jgi:hypothetical protein